MNRIRQWFRPEDTRHIYNIPLPPQNEKDSWVWLEEDHGNFTLKSAYRLLKENRQDGPLTHWSYLWNSSIHPRIKILGWQLLKDILPTKDKLVRIIPMMHNQCPMCDGEKESSHHLFWSCPFAKAIWFGSLWGHQNGLLQLHQLGELVKLVPQ